MFEWSEVCGAERPGAMRVAVMGIVNVTPDSFSDGGQFLDADAAIAHGLALVEAGADLLDVGGESTRPGADPVDDVEERRRVLPVIEALAVQVGVPVSVDTAKASVADAALGAGARIVNDVSAGRNDPDLLGVVAHHRAGYIAMHMQFHPTALDSPSSPRLLISEAVRGEGAFLVDATGQRFMRAR